MAMTLVALEVNVPDGYSVVGYRAPVQGDHYLDRHGIVRYWSWDTFCDESFLILRKLDRWRPAQPEDMIRVIKGERVVARFRDNEDQGWEEGYLQGYRLGNREIYYGHHEGFVLCEVKE